MTLDTRCRALLVSAIASGQGKTTVTAALAHRARRQGLRVAVFKTGPDFLDPTLLERASGGPVHQLDLWMAGVDGCRRLLHRAAAQCDLLLVEGVMGLYDGTPCTAELARTFGLPVAVVIDGSAMAQTFGALALGLRDFPGAPALAGVIANRVGSAGHAHLLAQSLPAGLPLLATLPDDPAHALPERHLGLHRAFEVADLDARIARAADALGGEIDAALQALPLTCFVAPKPAQPCERLLQGVRIGVARDEALSFVYPANLDALRELGAELHCFSPLQDVALPAVDALYLPGGYPELHAATFARNVAMHAALRAHHAAGKPLVAECGGLMLLMESLVDVAGTCHRMAGVLPGETRMHRSVQAIAPQAVTVRDAHGAPVGELRGHSYHHSSLHTARTPDGHARNPLGGPGEAVFTGGSLFASYVHLWFGSDLRATAALFQPGTTNLPHASQP